MFETATEAARGKFGRGQLVDERVSMAADDEDSASPLEEFLRGPALDPETFGEPPLRDGEDPLLTRDRVELEADEE
jgi:hypothetical protein